MSKGSAILLCCLWAILGVNLAAQHAVFDAIDLGGDYKESTWFDQYSAKHYPWIYHQEHGWMYVAKADSDQIWLWDSAVGWFWTTPEAYPVLFNDLSGWVDYMGIENTHRKFWDYSVGEVLTDAVVSEGLVYFPVPGPLEYYTWAYQIVGGQTVTQTQPDLSLSMTFETMNVSFDGSTLVRNTAFDADISGYGIIEGTQYPLTGIASSMGLEHMGWNALGLYQTQVDTSMFTQFSLAGVTFEVTIGISLDGFDEILVGFPWKGDLYQIPVGTVYTQECLDGWIEGEKVFSIVGYPEETEREMISSPLGAPLYLRYEIVARHPSYYVAGHMYENVVEVSYRQDVADPNDGSIDTEDGRHWYAPGIGLIKASGSDPMFADPLNIELVHSNLW